MGDLTQPRLEGTVRVGDRRKLGIAEFGAPHGPTVLWMHGTPGARRQIPDEARRLADAERLRIVGIDRPGVGLFSGHLYDSVLDWVDDLERVVDQLGIERFSIVGLSGGGPYALAAAVGLPDRVDAVGVLGGVVPTTGLDAAPGGLVGVAHRFRPLLPLVKEPAGLALATAVRIARPLGSPALDLYARLSPPGDRAVLARPDIKAMFLDDLSGNGSKGLRSVLYDSILFTRHWGFDVAEVGAPVTWWHGDADNIVPVAHAEHLVPRIPRATLRIRPGESHLGGLGIATEVVSAVLAR